MNQICSEKILKYQIPWHTIHNLQISLFQVTYRALEQLNESGFDLIKVENVVRRQTRQSQNLESLLVSTSSPTPETQPLKSQTESSNKENSSKGHQRLRFINYS